MTNPTLNLLLSRKTVRAFEATPLSDEQKEGILQAAMRAPTAGNQMLYTILDIEDPGLKGRLAVLCDDQPFIASAPLVLVFLADCRRWMDVYQAAGAPHRLPGPADLMLAVEDAMIAAHASVVAADSLGLGSCYIGDIVENREQIVELLHLDPYVFPATLVIYGVPTAQQRTREQPARFAREFIVQKDHYQRLDPGQARRMVEQRHADPGFDFDTWVKKFCDRKYMSGFSQEMNRSVTDYLNEFRLRDRP